MTHDKIKELVEKKKSIFSLTGIAFLWALAELRELELELINLQSLV